MDHRAFLIPTLALAACSTFADLDGTDADDEEGDEVGTTDVATADTGNDMPVTSGDMRMLDDLGPGSRDTGSDTGAGDLGDGGRADMGPSDPYDPDRDSTNDFFETPVGELVLDGDPRSFTLSVEPTRAFAAWVDGEVGVPGPEVNAVRLETIDLDGNGPWSLGLELVQDNDLPPGDLIEDPEVRLWYLGAGSTAISVTDRACQDAGSNHVFNWRHEAFGAQTFIDEPDPGDCATGSPITALRPIVVGGQRDSPDLTLGSFGFALFQVNDDDGNVAFLRRSGAPSRQPLVAGVGPADAGAEAFVPIPTHGHRIFFWGGGDVVYSTNLWEDDFETFTPEQWSSVERPGVAYLGGSGGEAYGLFPVRDGALYAQTGTAFADGTLDLGDRVPISEDDAVQVEQVSAIPFRRGADEGRNLVVVANTERQNGTNYFAQRVVSFDEDVPVVIACRRRAFPESVTKLDVHVGAFRRSGDLFAVALTPYEMGGTEYLAAEGFRFPNLGLRRSDVLPRRDADCQDRPL